MKNTKLDEQGLQTILQQINDKVSGNNIIEEDQIITEMIQSLQPFYQQNRTTWPFSSICCTRGTIRNSPCG